MRRVRRFLHEVKISFDAHDQGAGTRPLTEDDTDIFTQKVVNPKPPRNVEAIKRELNQRNFVRMRRLRREFRWVQKQMKKMGLNPEDARWIL